MTEALTNGALSIGIIGAGRMGVTHHCIANTIPGARVIATADPSALMNKMLGKYAGVTPYKDYKALLKGEKLDAVLVCTPPAHNPEILKAVLDARLHAFVEKPFLLSAEHAAAFATRFAEAGLVNQVGYVNRFNDVFMRVREMLGEELIGKVHRFRSEMFSSTIVRPQTDEGWRASHASGGGAIYEMAAHAVDLVNFLFGAPDLVKGTALNRVYSTGVEDVVSSTFAYRAGVAGTLYVNWSDEAFRKPTNKLEVFGEEGKILADQHGMKVFLKSASAAHGLRQGWNQLYITDLFKNVPFYLRGNEFTAQLCDFVDCIRTGRAARCSFADGAATLKVIEAMFDDWSATERELAR